MIALIQRVSKASVLAKGYKTNSIDKGYLVFLGVDDGDTTSDVQKLAKKILKIRLFEDENNKLNQSIIESGGSILVISQFTLLANVKSGNRPSFHKAADKTKAEKFYQLFIGNLMSDGIKVKTGFFQTSMKVKLTNDGPVTIWLDSKTL